MALTTARKQALIEQFAKDKKDSGTTEAQIAIMTERINHLTEHLKRNSKDFSTRRGLMKLVGRRRRLLNYLKRHREPEQYKALLQDLSLRK